jgi:hypothetical protein
MQAILRLKRLGLKFKTENVRQRVVLAGAQQKERRSTNMLARKGGDNYDSQNNQTRN